MSQPGCAGRAVLETCGVPIGHAAALTIHQRLNEARREAGEEMAAGRACDRVVSVSRLLGPPEDGRSMLVEIAQVGRRLIPPRRHQVAVMADPVPIRPDIDVVVILVADIPNEIGFGSRR